jgi:hypothetical protein
MTMGFCHDPSNRALFAIGTASWLDRSAVDSGESRFYFQKEPRHWQRSICALLPSSPVKFAGDRRQTLIITGSGDSGSSDEFQ